MASLDSIRDGREGRETSVRYYCGRGHAVVVERRVKVDNGRRGRSRRTSWECCFFCAASVSAPHKNNGKREKVSVFFSSKVILVRCLHIRKDSVCI